MAGGVTLLSGGAQGFTGLQSIGGDTVFGGLGGLGGLTLGGAFAPLSFASAVGSIRSLFGDDSRHKQLRNNARNLANSALKLMNEQRDILIKAGGGNSDIVKLLNMGKAELVRLGGDLEGILGFRSGLVNITTAAQNIIAPVPKDFRFLGRAVPTIGGTQAFLDFTQGNRKLMTDSTVARVGSSRTIDEFDVSQSLDPERFSPVTPVNINFDDITSRLGSFTLSGEQQSVAEPPPPFGGFDPLEPAVSSQQRIDNLFGSDSQFGVDTFDLESDAFKAAEEAKTKLITSQQQLAALQADDAATQGQIDEAQGGLNLSIAGFLTGALALSGSALSSGLNEVSDIIQDDLNINLRSNLKISPDLSISGLLSRSQQQLPQQAGLLEQEPFKPIRPVIKNTDLPIKKVKREPVGFPVRGAGLLAA